MKVLTEATVSRIVFKDTDAETQEQSLTASGVEFIRGNKKFMVHAVKEVILSAGWAPNAFTLRVPGTHNDYDYRAIKSPQLLELSGVGHPDILSRIGAELRIDLPGVGENLQEHTVCGITYELDQGIRTETLDLLKDPGYAAAAIKLQWGHLSSF